MKLSIIAACLSTAVLANDPLKVCANTNQVCAVTGGSPNSTKPCCNAKDECVKQKNGGKYGGQSICQPKCAKTGDVCKIGGGSDQYTIKCCDKDDACTRSKNGGELGGQYTCQPKCAKNGKVCKVVGGSDEYDLKCCDSKYECVKSKNGGELGGQYTCQKKSTTTKTTKTTKTTTTTVKPAPTGCTDDVYGIMGPVEMVADNTCAQKVNDTVQFTRNCSESQFYNNSQWYIVFKQACDNKNVVTYNLINGEDQGTICSSENVAKQFVEFNDNEAATFGATAGDFFMQDGFWVVGQQIQNNFTYTSELTVSDNQMANVVNNTLVSGTNSSNVTFVKQASFNTYWF